MVASGFVLLSNSCVSVLGGLVEHMQKKQHVGDEERGGGGGSDERESRCDGGVVGVVMGGW